MSTWKVILATLVIFVAGLVTGALVVKKTAARTVSIPQNIWRTTMLKRLTDELSLSPGQREEIDAILHESNERTKLIWEFVGPYFQEEYRELNEELRSALTPEQRKKFDLLLKQRQRRINEKQPPEFWRLFQPSGGGGSQQQPKGNRPANEQGQRRQDNPAVSPP